MARQILEIPKFDLNFEIRLEFQPWLAKSLKFRNSTRIPKFESNFGTRLEFQPWLAGIPKFEIRLEFQPNSETRLEFRNSKIRVSDQFKFLIQVLD